MIWSTHVMAGLNTLWVFEVAVSTGLLPATSLENVALLAGAAAVGSLLPDLDAAQSKIKHLTVAGIKPFFLPSQLIYSRLGHRSLLHSLLGLVYAAVFGIAVMPIAGWQVGLAFWLGYASHLVMDASTRSGIPLLYPRPKRLHLVPPTWRVTTGSAIEEMIFVLLALSALIFLLCHLTT